MPWRPPFSEPLPADPSLDVFRDSVARLMLEDDTVGHIAFRVHHMRRLISGHLWWRQWAAPVEVVEWMQTMVDETDSYDLSQMSDGIIEDPVTNDWLLAVQSGEADDFRAGKAAVRYSRVARWFPAR